MKSQIFSLEIFIDRLRLRAGEKCLFPSTILKLLAFEPAQISEIDANLQKNLREYITPLEKTGKIRQIDDLKDSEGNYVIRKGKSMLFKTDFSALMSELNVLPLYIIVTDDFYYPNHLTGVVTINLSSLIYKLSQKLAHQSITVSENISGKFPVVNLMGDGIGALSLNIKLIYIGDNLSRHVAVEEVIEVRPKLTDYLQNTSDKYVGDSRPKSVDDDCYNSPPPILKTVRHFGCQADEKRSIRIQVQPNVPLDYLNKDKSARIGLTIDPNDPLLEGPPPMIYNSNYYYESDDEKDNQFSKPSSLPEKPIPTSLPQNIHSDCKIISKKKELIKPKIGFNRSKSVPLSDKNSTEFLKRMSKPKHRPMSPNGIVPKNIGWLRMEPQFTGPKKSTLEYKLTKTQIKRIQLKNPSVYDRFLENNPKTPATKRDEIVSNRHFSRIPSKDMDGDNTATSYTELAQKIRHPLVPPLFNPGTSISVPSFTQTDSFSQNQNYRDSGTDDRNQRLPPKSPDRQKNNSSHVMMSYETNETLDEADHILNLNPVQSNMSPQMTIRSQTFAVDYDDEDSQDDRQHYDYTNGSDENSDEFNGSLSSSNGPRSASRRYSNASQISQTSEWKTSRGSSISQNYFTKQDSPPESPVLGTYRSPPKSPVKARRSLLSNGMAPGGRFNDISSNRNMKLSESFPAYFDESAEQRTNYTTSDSVNIITERDQDNTMRSLDHIDGNRSQLRPGSAGGDVTSITRVTKFDRSLAPGRLSNIGTNHLTSTVASMQTDDSQMLTSGSFY